MTLVLGFPVEHWGSSAIGTYLIPGTDVRLSMRKEVAPLLIAVARDYHREVEPLHKGWCWGFDPKHIEGSSFWSNHAWGGAIDLNAPAHPMGKRNTFSPPKRAAIRTILARYTYHGRQVIRWGGTYLRRPDDMHFELNVPRDLALAAVKALQAPAASKPKPKPVSSGHQPGTRVLRLTDPLTTGADVGFVQRWLGADDDGKYGPATRAEVVRYQHDQGLAADGVVGENTWSRMLGRTIRF